MLQIVPYLISMGTDNDITIRSKAHQQVKELDKKYPGFIQVTYLLRPFPNLGSAQRVFNLHVLRSCASSIVNPFSFMSFLITSLHISFGRPIFRCPPSSMFSLLCLLQSFSPHGLTISVSRLLFSHLCLPHLPLLLFLHS